jgi:apolipoprotein N-acyltransferase
MVLITGFAGVAWLVYARSQKGRRQAGVLCWLSLPFFALCLMYAWIAITHGYGAAHVTDTRFGIMSIALPQAIILITLSFLYGGNNGKRN